MIRFLLLVFFLMPLKSYGCFQINTESFKAETRDVFVEILGLFEMLESILQDTISYYENEPKRFSEKHTDSPLKAVFPHERKLPNYFKLHLNNHKTFFMNDLKSIRRFKKYLEHYLIKGNFKEVNNTCLHNPKIKDNLAIEYLYEKFKKLFSKLHEKEPKIENDIVMTSFCMSFIEKINEYIDVLKLNVHSELLPGVTIKEKLVHDGLQMLYNSSPIYKQDETYNYINDKLIELLKDLSSMGQLINQASFCQKIEEDKKSQNVEFEKPIIHKIIKKESVVTLNSSSSKAIEIPKHNEIIEPCISDSINLSPHTEIIIKKDQHDDLSSQIIDHTQNETPNDEIEEDRWWTKINVEKLYREQKRYPKDISKKLSVIPKIYTEEEKINIILASYSNAFLEQILKPGRYHLKELNWSEIDQFLKSLGANVERHSGSRYFVVLNQVKTCFHAHGKIYEDTINTHLKGFLIDALFKTAILVDRIEK
ncbi:MAG: hypothetical protein Q8L85_10455 [Alphaproteobacteria bacterium]|nr:hypothetical protein [Alphaproteobacteria bacterium]